MIKSSRNFDISGVKLFNVKSFEDHRGSFSEVFLSNSKHKEFGINYVQENQSISKYGVFRGMHFQKGNYSQAKLIRIIKGKALDFICDLRVSSPSFKKIITIDLNPENILFLPKGLAHGFLCLEDNTILNYKCDNYYDPKSESGFNLFNSNINFDMKLKKDRIILSNKDNKLPNIDESYVFKNL